MVPQSAKNNEASSSNSSTDATEQNVVNSATSSVDSMQIDDNELGDTTPHEASADLPGASSADSMQLDDDGVDFSSANETSSEFPNTSLADLMQLNDDGMDFNSNEALADLTSANSMEQNVTDNVLSSNNAQSPNDMSQCTSIETQSNDIESQTAMETTNIDETSSSNVSIAAMEERLHSLRVQLGLVNPSSQTPPRTQPKLSSPTTSQTKSESHVQPVSSLPPTRQAEAQTQSPVHIRPASSISSTSHPQPQSQAENDPAVQQNEQPQLRLFLRSLPVLPQVLRIRGRRVSTPPSMVAIKESPDDEDKENIHTQKTPQ